MLSQIYVTTDGQSASLSSCQAPIWSLRPNFYYCHTVAGLLMWGALPVTREWVCRLELMLVLARAVFLGPSPVGPVTIFYCLRFETLPTWRARSSYSYPPGTGWPSYTPRHWVHSWCSESQSLYVKVKVTLRLTVGQSVSLGVEPHLGLMTRYLLLF
jgi:hypothetical protein